MYRFNTQAVTINMKKATIPFIINLFFFSFYSFAQKQVVNVNPLTGTANVIIPVYQINRGQVSFPINLVYSATGVKPKDVEGTAGMGWQLQAGGQIQRQVRGLPDDVMKDNLGNSELGWMYITSTTATKVTTFSIANDNNPATCGDDTTDINYINNYFGYAKDTEPDIFYVNAPGLSCELVFDKVSGKFKPVNYQDLVITYTAYTSTDTYAGQITGFTITNDKGIRYNFSLPEQTRETAYVGTATYLKNTYVRYQNGITYFNSWHLTSILDDEGNGVILNYSAAPARYGTDPVSLYMPGTTTPTLQYQISTAVTPEILTSVYGNYDVDNPSDVLTFTWNTNTFTPGANGGTGQTVITSISGVGSTWNFHYESLTFNPQPSTIYVRDFLTEFSQSSLSVPNPTSSSPIDYQFSYNGENLSNGSVTLPDSSTTKLDYWGYYSNNSNSSLMPKVWIAAPTTSIPQYAIYNSITAAPSYPYYTTNGNVRTADAANVMAGSLNKISYVEGGSTTFTYESNDYLDYPSGVVAQGGGMRIKQVVDDDGSGSGNTITRNYTYTNPVTGLSSGEPLSLPTFAFNVPYSGSNTGNSLWNSATVVSDNDLSQEDHTIMYSYVKESQTGAGSTLYQYYVPASYWNTTAAPGCSGCSGIADYASTIMNTQRLTCATNTGPIANNIYGYPFAPNENYDFERGLIQKVTNYNDANAEVSETNYTYQRSYTPTVIACFKWDNNPFPSNASGVRNFSKYTTNYNTNELVTTVSKTIYDSPTLSQAQTSTTTYAYTGTNHKKVTLQQTTNSDNSVVATNYKYVKDLSPVSSTNRNINALYNLQLLNINAPVETWQQVTRAGVTKTTAASLTYYLDFPSYSSFYKYRPSTQYKFFSATGVTDFAPSSISGTILNKYGSYFATADFTGYNILGDLQTADDAHSHVNGVVLDNISGQPAVTIANAAAAEMFFADFDSDIQAPWAVTKTGTSTYTAPAGSHNYNAAGLGTGQSFTCTINKNALASNYIFSAWVNTLAAGTITFTLTPTTGSAVTSTQTLAATSGAWQYQEWTVPVSAMTTSFTVAISANENLGMDDLLFYPQTAEVTTYAYDPVTHFKTAVTNTNGVSAYYTDDTWGRPVYTMDQDHNILKKNTYMTLENVQDWTMPTAVTAPSGSVYKNIATSFSTNAHFGVGEIAGTVVNWTFGDGGTATTDIATPPSHTYTAIGTYTVNATAYSSVFGSKVLTPVSVTVLPTPVNVSITNNTSYGYSLLTTTFYSATTGQTYTFSGTTGGSVPPDTYLVNVYVSGGQLYNSSTGVGYSGVMLSGSCVYLCQDYTSNNRAQFTNVNISACTSVNVLVSTQTCTQLSE